MSISFQPLNKLHLPLLLKWLQSPHVRAWWDQGIDHTKDSIRRKYSSYVEGYKLIGDTKKPIKSFVVYAEDNPVGYIQIYNAYDFPRDKQLVGLPENLGALDFFIGDEKALGQGFGSKAILEFIKLHGDSYSHIFVDPSVNNIAAIKCFEKAGFVKVLECHNTEDVWMLKSLSTRNEPLLTIKKLIKERYADAKAVFWAGSVVSNQGTSNSDLDLIIVYEELPHAYREAFIYEGWPIDAFVHDIGTLKYFIEESRVGNGISGLSYMILNGFEVTTPNTLSETIKKLAEEYQNLGPAKWTQEQIDKERFLISDILDDIKFPRDKMEQINSAVHLFEPLLQFYFRAEQKWTASGKSLIRMFKKENPTLAQEWILAFEDVVRTGDANAVERVVTKILQPYGGVIWDGFKSDAPHKCKFLDENIILEELKSREPIFHHPERFGKTKKDIENQMCEEFWEVGASGNTYTRQDVMDTLLKRYSDPDFEDDWEAKDFNLTKISEDNYLLTYTLIQNKTRISKRSTIWRRINGNWKILYHQGTISN